MADEQSDAIVILQTFFFRYPESFAACRQIRPSLLGRPVQAMMRRSKLLIEPTVNFLVAYLHSW